MVYIYTLYYSALKGYKDDSSTYYNLDGEDIMLSEIKQFQKQILYDLIYKSHQQQSNSWKQK